MTVEVTANPVVTPSLAQPLFDDRFLATMGENHIGFDSMPDGRLLMLTRAEGTEHLVQYVRLALNLVQPPAARR